MRFIRDVADATARVAGGYRQETKKALFPRFLDDLPRFTALLSASVSS